MKAKKTDKKPGRNIILNLDYIRTCRQIKI